MLNIIRKDIKKEVIDTNIYKFLIFERIVYIYYVPSFCVLEIEHMPKKVLSYEEKNYNRKKAMYDVLAQVLQDIKIEQSGMHNWNLPVEQLKGITSRFDGSGLLELTYHRLEVATIEGMAHKQEDGKKFLETVVKELKKKFKKYTGKTLELKKIREDQAIDKYSRLQADTSWMLGSSRYGYGSRPVGRYLVRDSCVYQFDTEMFDGPSSL